MIRKFQKFLQEKLIIPGKGKRYGQVVILAGGSASGKTYAKNHFIKSEDYKVIDPDDVKYLMVALSNKGSEHFKAVKGIDPIEIGLNKKTYRFETEEQLKYFMMGVDEANGWLEYEVEE